MTVTNKQFGTNVHEIADDIFRINTPVAIEGAGGFSFNQYLIVDDEPLLAEHREHRREPAEGRAHVAGTAGGPAQGAGVGELRPQGRSRLLRTAAADGPGQGVAVRGLQAEVVAPGQLSYQLLVMQPGRSPGEFSGRYELQLHGELDGKPWSQPLDPATSAALQFKQYQRVGSTLAFPELAEVRGVQVRVVDGRGAVRASQDIQL